MVYSYCERCSSTLCPPIKIDDCPVGDIRLAAFLADERGKKCVCVHAYVYIYMYNIASGLSARYTELHTELGPSQEYLMERGAASRIANKFRRRVYRL